MSEIQVSGAELRRALENVWECNWPDCEWTVRVRWLF